MQEKLNGYMVESAAAVRGLLNSQPLGKKVTLEVRGIVGGDYTVTATRPSSTRGDVDLDVTIEHAR